MTDFPAIRTILECTKSHYWDDDTLKEAWAEYEQAKHVVDVLKDALARIANTYGLLEDSDNEKLAKALREFAWAALQCKTVEEYEALLSDRNEAV